MPAGDDSMVRLIKRYGSRKLYDTEESRYVSLEEIAAWIRKGQQIRVVDNKTSEDVTVATLTQVISEEGRKGTSLFPSELLHELIRAGGRAVSTGVEQLQEGVGRLVKASVEKLAPAPVRQVREETQRLRRRLEELEATLAKLEARDRARGDAEPEGAAQEGPAR
ncbi:MAG: hypothetical protein D6718_00080 [Acidobacteria bacterium]|nr:MAG: hypothetical protein D6718_00080 [Acidobacteriota bacterium]